jgi:hypothetical protein
VEPATSLFQAGQNFSTLDPAYYPNKYSIQRAPESTPKALKNPQHPEKLKASKT